MIDIPGCSHAVNEQTLNICISEKYMTQMGREYIRDLFSLLQLNLLL
jgi:hypothetical protein